MRVSADGQETGNQLLQMARFVESQGWEHRDFVDHQSGKTAQRPQLQALFAAAACREVDVVVFWSLDRLDLRVHWPRCNAWPSLVATASASAVTPSHISILAACGATPS
jgi:hypothetical protein